MEWVILVALAALGAALGRVLPNRATPFARANEESLDAEATPLRELDDVEQEVPVGPMSAAGGTAAKPAAAPRLRTARPRATRVHTPKPPR